MLVPDYRVIAFKAWTAGFEAELAAVESRIATLRSVIESQEDSNE